MQWFAELIRQRDAQPLRSDGTHFLLPNSATAAYLSFAYNVFLIESHSRLDESLIDRLKHRDQFQGARHEVFAEATCLRAGFVIEREDETDRSRRHAEFTAKHRPTGEVFSVEAKSKHRPGILGRPGVPEPPHRLNLRFGSLLNDALKKNPPHPLVIFLDSNLPLRAARRLYGTEVGRPSPLMDSIIRRIRKEHGGVDPYAMLVFTNMADHFSPATERDPLKPILAVIPFVSREAYMALWDLQKAAYQYVDVPHEFPTA